MKKINGLEKNKVYITDCKMVKFCNENVWEHICNN